MIGWLGGTSFEVISHPKEVHKAFTVNNELFVRPMNSNILKWEDGQLKTVEEFKDEKARNLVALFFDGDGFFGYEYNNALFEVNSKGFKTVGATQANNLLAQAKVYDMTPISDGNYAVSTLLNGMFIINRDGKILQHIWVKNGLLSNAVKHVFEDRDGNLWLSLESGVARVEWQSKARYLNKNHNYTNAISMYSYNGRLFLGKEDGLYEFVKDDNNLFGEFIRLVDTRDIVLDIKHIDNTLLIACDKFLWSMDLTSNKAEMVYDGDVYNVSVHIQKNTGKRIVITGFSDLRIYEFSGGKFTLLNEINVPNQRVFSIEPITDDWIVLSVYDKKLRFLDLRDGIQNAKIVVEPDREKRPDVFIYKINQAFGEFYGVSIENTYHINKDWRSNDTSQVLSKANMLADRNLGEEFDSWFIVQVTDSSVFNIAANEHYLTFIDKDLIAVNPINPAPKSQIKVPLINSEQLLGAARFGDGRVVRIEDTRAVILDQNNITSKDQDAYAPLIRQIKLIDTDSVVYFGDNENKRRVVIAADQNSLRFEFASPQYFASSKLEYRYQLEGFDKEFSDWSEENKKDYTNLPAGTLTFKVQVKNEENVESAVGEFTFDVLAPWYLSKGAYVVYFLLFIGFVVLIVRWQTGKVLAKEAEKARVKDIEYRAESAELQAKVAEAQAKAMEEENNRKTAELEQARQIQTQLLPKIPPNSPQWNIEVCYQTASEVGGDYYDFVQTKSGDLLIFVGDATGHGLAASLMVTMVKSALTFLNADEPHKILAALNIGLKKIRLSRLSMALTAVQYKDGKATFSSAAMPPLYKVSNNGVEEFMVSGPPLGALSFAKFETREISLEVGEKLIILSDGLPECIDTVGSMFGYEKMNGILHESRASSVEQITHELFQNALQFMNGASLDDDITLVGLERLA